MPLYSLPSWRDGQGIGHTDRIDRGTGLARPLGVEGHIRYGNLTLNVRNWLDTYLVTQIDGLADADVRDSRDVNPGRHGETYFDAFYGGRTIVLTGKIRANTIQKLRDMQQALKQAFSDLSVEKPLVFASQSATDGVMIYCKKSQPIAMAEIQQDFTYRRDFQVTLRASNPRFLSYVQAFGDYLPTAPLAAGTAKQILALNNDGNFAAEPRISIAGPVNASTPGGPALTLTNTVSDDGVLFTQGFTLNAPAGQTVAIPDGAKITLDSAHRTIELVAANGTTSNAYAQYDISSEWIEFHPGENSIELTCFGEGSQPYVIVRYRHTYL